MGLAKKSRFGDKAPLTFNKLTDNPIILFIVLATIIFMGLAFLVNIFNDIKAQEIISGNFSDTLLGNNGTILTLSKESTEFNEVSKYNLSYLEFDGTSDFLNTSSVTGSSVGRNFTAIVWARLNVADKTQYLFTDSATSVTPLIWCENANLNLRETLNADIQISNYCSDSVGKWTMFIMGYNSTSFYIGGNGEILGSKTGGNNPVFTLTFSVGGSRTSSSVSVNGDIGEVRFYNISLPESQLELIYTNFMKSNVSVLNDLQNDTSQILYIPIKEQSGLITHDLATHYNNATIKGNPTWGTDGLNNTLVNGQDYKSSPTNVTLINPDLSWSQININYVSPVTSATLITSLMKLATLLLTISILIFISAIVFNWINHTLGGA